MLQFWKCLKSDADEIVFSVLHCPCSRLQGELLHGRQCGGNRLQRCLVHMGCQRRGQGKTQCRRRVGADAAAWFCLSLFFCFYHHFMSEWMRVYGAYITHTHTQHRTPSRLFWAQDIVALVQTSWEIPQQPGEERRCKYLPFGQHLHSVTKVLALPD